MSLVAIIPVANLAAANAALEELGFGPNNFGVPAYGSTGPTHAALHAWDDPAFEAAVASLSGVVTNTEGGDPVARTKALIEAQGAKWGEQAPELPNSGTVTAGTLYRYDEDELWSVIQTFNRSVYGEHPSTYPALIRRIRNPYVVSEWRQPIDQYDAYKLVNPFTGLPDRAVRNGQRWRVNQADAAGNNVWEPGVYGWVLD